MIDFTNWPECGQWQVYTDNCRHTSLFVSITILIISIIVMIWLQRYIYKK